MAAICSAGAILAAAPSLALPNQILIFGKTLSAADTPVYTAPGASDVYKNFAAPGGAEKAARVIMFEGSLSNFRAKAVLSGAVPKSGGMTFKLWKNGAPVDGFSCTITAAAFKGGSGRCHYTGASLLIATGDTISVEITHDMTGFYDAAVTYSMLYD